MNYIECPICRMMVLPFTYHACFNHIYTSNTTNQNPMLTEAVPYPAIGAPDGLQYCPGCGAPMLQPDHTCHKAAIPLEAKPTEAAMRQAMLTDRDTLKLEHVKRLAMFIIEHEKTCEKCQFFAERGSSVRCAEYLNMDKVCSKWQKRVEGKV